MKNMLKPFVNTAYCLAYVKYADRYVDISYQFKYFNLPKDSQNICDELKSTVVCHECTKDLFKIYCLYLGAFYVPRRSCQSHSLSQMLWLSRIPGQAKAMY
jgi:hypothetical protein